MLFRSQWAQAPFRNPLGRFVVAVTDWAVRPVRRLLPGLFGLDLASLLLAWLAQWAYAGLIIGIAGLYASPAMAAAMAAFGALMETLSLGLYLAVGVIIVTAILSWVNPYAPLAPVFNLLARPLLRPVQRLIPPVGGVDLSPLVVLLALQVLRMALDAYRLPILRL